MSPDRTNSRRACVRAIAAALVIAVTLPAAAQLQPRQRVVRTPPGPPQRLTGVEALRALHKSGKPADAERMAYSLLWKDVRQPEVLYLLASTEERLKKPQEAAAYYALFLRALDEPGAAAAPPDVLKQRPFAERRLKALRQDDDSLAAAYAKAAAGKKFTSPEAVDDAWMNNVRGDLHSLHGLYAWKLVGGRKDAEADWVHNTQGAMHRSGLKRVDEVEGRKGVLFTVPLKDMNSQDADASNREALQKLGHNSRIEASNVAGGKFLRAGVRGYGFPVLVKVKVGDKELHSETVGTDKWHDLKVELPPVDAAAPARPKAAPPAASPSGAAPPKPAPAARAAAAPAGARVVMELIVPEGQKWSEGVWIDYFEFFAD